MCDVNEAIGICERACAWNGNGNSGAGGVVDGPREAHHAIAAISTAFGVAVKDMIWGLGHAATLTVGTGRTHTIRATQS